MDKDPKFKQAVNDVGEVAVDFVESQLFQLIRDGNPASTIYYMKTKGRHRGYAERLEVTGAEGGPLQVHINMIRDDQTSDDID